MSNQGSSVFNVCNLDSLRGRFILEFGSLKSNAPEVYCSGGFWAEIGKGIKLDDPRFDLELKVGGITKSKFLPLDDADEWMITSKPADPALFGDSLDISRGRTWLGLSRSRLQLFGTHAMSELLSGRGQLVIGSYFEKYVPWKFDLTLFQPSKNQIVILPPVHIPSFFSDLNQIQLAGQMVSRSEFDSFCVNLFSAFGNDTDQAMRAKRRAVEHWIARPLFNQDPRWQVLLCFLIRGSLPFSAAIESGGINAQIIGLNVSN